MVQFNNATIILVISLVIGIIVIKFLAKSFHRVLGLIVLLTIGVVYAYFYTNIFTDNKESKVLHAIENKVKYLSVLQYQKKHCQGVIRTKNDSITCECIVSPLVNDMIERLNAEEIRALETDKSLYMKELMISLRNTQQEIQFNLKEKKAIYLWNKMVINLKNGKVIGE